MNKLQRHEAAQRASIAEKESWGWTCISASTTAPCDYIMVKRYLNIINGKFQADVQLVEIKTGTGRLTPLQKELHDLFPEIFRWERWEVNGFKKPVLVASG